MNKYITLIAPYKSLVQGVKYRISSETATSYITHHTEVPKLNPDIQYSVGEIQTTRMDTYI